MSAAWDVLGLGAITVDDLLYVEHYPQPDTKTPVRAMRREGGGLAGTAPAAAVARGESIDRTVIFASAAAALKATRRGGRSGTPRRADVERFLSERR